MSFLDYLTSPIVSGPLLILKILFLIFGLFFAIGTIYLFLTTTWFRRLVVWDLKEILTYKPYGLKRISKRWSKVKERMGVGTEPEAKIAVIEADAILDEILNKMGYEGGTLGERLRNLTATILPNVEDVSEAHKIRNNIVHDPTYILNLEEAKKAISAYEKALSDLQAL